MDLGLDESCQFEQSPRERAWVADDPETIGAPEEESITCSRQSIDGTDYCAFHLPDSERQARDIDTGKRLRERLDGLAEGQPPTPKNTDFRGAALSVADLSGLDFGSMAGFTIDFRYADIDRGIDLSGLTFTGAVDCRFARCDTLTGVDTELGKLDCAGMTFRNRLPTAMGDTNRAVSLRRETTIETVRLADASVRGDVFVNDVTIESGFDGRGVTVEGRFQLTAETASCILTGADIGDSFIIEGGTLGLVDCASMDAEEVMLQHVTLTDKATVDESGLLECSRLTAETVTLRDVTATRIVAVSMSIRDLQLDTVAVSRKASFRREETVPATLNRLHINECRFHGETRFDRLEPASAVINIDQATDRVVFRQFVCHDATFDPDAYPMFEEEVDFTGADLEGALLRNFQAGGRAVFTNADLTDARLLNADFDGAILEGTLFSRARLVGASLADAYLYHASLSDASIDASTEFGERAVYDPRSSTAYDPSFGLETGRHQAASATAGQQTAGDRGTPQADGGSTDSKPSEKRPDATVHPAQKAKEVYQSIHESARQSGDSETAIDTYQKRQEMGTELLKSGHATDERLVPHWLQIRFRQAYGLCTGYGVRPARILVTSIGIIALAIVAMLPLAGQDGNTSAHIIGALGGFVGTTPGLNVSSPVVNLIIGVEALFGAVFVALFVNALGRRSSM
jgi:uncharacterized protein YjbI with pentapeptide repeats